MSSNAVVIDIGNSRIKIGVYHGGSFVKNMSCGHDQFNPLKLIQDDLVPVGGAKQFRWVLAGVVPKVVHVVREALVQLGQNVCLLENAFQIGVKLSVDEPEKVGVDRLLASKAAYYLGGGSPCMVVDAGTALTINWMDANGVFQGGSIQPGWDLMAKALGAGTARLPEVELPDSMRVEWPAKNTRKAIQVGIGLAMVGAVEHCWDIVLKREPAAVLWITGGGGDLLKGGFVSDARFHPNLVLEGMILATR
jgi:type III pantothenate kinase